VVPPPAARCHRAREGVVDRPEREVDAEGSHIGPLASRELVSHVREVVPTADEKEVSIPRGTLPEGLQQKGVQREERRGMGCGGVRWAG
jgi:hypothetical protein